jgi:flavin reductase (DIM6/NTAB) family NADH-FMN oxidoreductase RutF
MPGSDTGEMKQAALRRALGQFATGVTVITAQGPKGPIGFTASSFNSVSLDPPLILWCLAQNSERLGAYRAAPGYAVNVLNADQAEIASRFASKLEDRFAGIGWTEGRNGAPVLDGSLAVFECEHEAIHDAGDHQLFVGRVLRCAEAGGAPLTYFGGGFGTLADEVGADAEAIGENDLLTLLARASGVAHGGPVHDASDEAAALRRALRKFVARRQDAIAAGEPSPR